MAFLRATLVVAVLRGALAERAGVCDGSGYQNLGWSGMSKSACFERAVQSNSSGSCAFLSFAPTFNNGQTGCWCFNAGQCQNVQASPDGQDGSWTTWGSLATDAADGSPISSPTPAPPSNAVSTQRVGVCNGAGYQNLGWSGMTQSLCVERAVKANLDGSCAFLSFAPTFNSGQTGCWCFKADECQSVRATPDGQDGVWTTWRGDALHTMSKPGSQALEWVFIVLILLGAFVFSCISVGFWCRSCKRFNVPDYKTDSANDVEAPVPVVVATVAPVVVSTGARL